MQSRFSSVRFAVSGTISFSANYDRYPGKTPYVLEPGSASTDTLSGELLFDLSTHRLRRRKISTALKYAQDEDRVVKVPNDEVVVHNGDRYKSFRPHEQNGVTDNAVRERSAELHIYRNQARTVVLGSELSPVTYACGMIHTNLQYDWIDTSPEIRVADFRHEETIEEDGRKLLILRTRPGPKNRFFEFTVDAEDHRIILMVQGFGLNQRGKLWITTRIDYQATEFGPMPQSWVIHRYGLTGDGVATYAMQLDEFEANPVVTDEDFDFSPPPGTVVYDETRPKDSMEYVIGEAGKPNLPVGEHLLLKEEGRSARWTYAIVGVIFAMVLGAVVLSRRQKDISG